MSGWKLTAVLGCAGLILLGWGSVAHGELFGDYVGYKACEPCHGDLVAGWETTPHARAFADLKKPGADNQDNPGCVKCHVVAYGKEGGFIDAELTPELENVQCESCHGPGKIHTETVSAEDIVGDPGAEVCRECHTEGQDKNFDYEKKVKSVHGE